MKLYLIVITALLLAVGLALVSAALWPCHPGDFCSEVR